MGLSPSDWIGLAALVLTQGGAIIWALMRNANRVERLEVKVDQVISHQLFDHGRRLDRLEEQHFSRAN